MKGRILLTGASGFIGSKILEHLKEEYEVTAVSSTISSGIYCKLNLLDKQACEQFFTKQAPYDIIIHAAAIAHGKNHVDNMSVYEANILMTKNIFHHLDVSRATVIFLSSVSVYSYKNIVDDVVSIKEVPQPLTSYGKSKLLCESIIKDTNPNTLHILRLTPVFSDENLKDIRKRVYLPVLGIPFRTKQNRTYSLCHIDTIPKSILKIIPQNSQTLILKDQKDYSQDDIMNIINPSKNAITINQKLIDKAIKIAKLLPFSKKDIIIDMLYKLFFSNKFSD